MGCVQSYFRKAQNAGLSPSSTHGSEKAGIPQDATADVADLVEQPEKEPLEVADIQNEDEFTLAEKPNESTTEVNGTVKPEDGDTSKPITAANEKLAAISVAATVATETSSDEEKKEPAEEMKIDRDSGSANVSASQEPANSKVDTAEVTEGRDVESPKSTKSESEAVVVEAASEKSDTEGEKEQSGSASTLVKEDTAISREESPSIPVPDNKLSTAKSEEIPEQCRRPTSASQIVVDEEYGGSRPTSAGLEGTIPTSASSAEEESVPEQQKREETDVSPSGNESMRNRSQSTTEQDTKSQNASHPVSATDSNKEANTQTSYAESSKDNIEISENLVVELSEEARVDNPQATNTEGADRPVSGVQDSERPASVTGSVTEEVNISQSAAELNKEEECRSEVSAVGNVELSEEANGIRPVSITVPVKEDSSRPISAVELTTQEEDKPASSAVHTTEVSEKPVKNQPNSTLTAKEVENIASGNEDMAVEPAEKRLLNADELEDGANGLDISGVDAAEESIETTVSQPVDVEFTKENETQAANAVQQTKEEEIVAAKNFDKTEEATVSRPLAADELEADESVPEISAINIVEYSKEIERSLPVSVPDSTKEGISPQVSIKESAKGEESRLVNSAVDNAELSEETTRSGMDGATSGRASSTTVTDKEEDEALNATDIEKYERSRPISVADNEVSNNLSESQPVSDSTPGEDIDRVCVKEPTKQVGGSPASASESAKKDEIVSASSTEGNAEITEESSEHEQRLAVASSTEGEVNRSVDAEVSKKEEPSRLTTSIAGEECSVESGEQTSAKEDTRPGTAAESNKEGRISIGAVESTKDDKIRSAAESIKEENGSSSHNAVGPTREEEGGLLSTVEPAKEEESRPIIDEGVENLEGPASEAESIKCNEKRVCDEGSTKDERLESDQEEGSRLLDAVDSTNEEESRQGNNEESVNKESRPGTLSGSTKDEDITPSAAADADTAEPSRSLSVSVSSSVIEESIPASSTTKIVDVSAETTGIQPTSDTQSTKEESPRASSAVAQEFSTEEQAVPGVENESEEVVAEPKADIQIAKSRPVSSTAEQELENTTSRPLSATPPADIQQRTEDGKSTAEVGNDSRPPSASRSVGAESEITKDASEQGLLSIAVAGTTERVESPTSAQSDDIPSLTLSEAANDPGSDNAADPSLAETKSVEDEKKPATEVADKEMTVQDETKTLNTAATVIQASFRGYQTRQALSKTAEKYEVPQPVTSHDFLFGPAVQSSFAAEGSSVTSTPKNPETGVEQQEANNELKELQKPQECDEIRAAQEDTTDDVTDVDTSTAATKIQAGVRGFLVRRHIHNMKTSNSTTAPSIGDSQQSLGDVLASQETEDEGVHTSGSVETEVQKQQQLTTEEDISQSQEDTSTTKKSDVQNGLSLDSHLEKTQRVVEERSALSLQLDGPAKEDEDREVWQTLQQEELDDAATKIQSSYRGYRMRRSLKREDAVQMPTTSSSTITVTSDVIVEPMRHSGEFHDMMVLPPSPEEDITDASAQNHVVTASSTPLQSDDDVTPAAGNQETDMTESKQSGEAKMDERAEVAEAEAATKIQASYRGFKTRKDIKTANIAASKIQAGFRGYKVRKQLRENTEDDNKNGPRSLGSRPQSANQEEEEMKATNGTLAGDIEERSATKIQAGVRGYLVRKRRQAERDAAVKIQAGFRGYQARREVKTRQQKQQKK